jgi:uncharacterized protein (DUF885 family)
VSGNAWAIAAAILIAAMPHLWSFLTGQQKNRADLTTRLLENLQQSYVQQSMTAEELRTLINSSVQEPMTLARANAQVLRDLLGETAELRERMLKLEKRLEYVATTVTRLAQSHQPGPPGAP